MHPTRVHPPRGVHTKLWNGWHGRLLKTWPFPFMCYHAIFGGSGSCKSSQSFSELLELHPRVGSMVNLKQSPLLWMYYHNFGASGAPTVRLWVWSIPISPPLDVLSYQIWLLWVSLRGSKSVQQVSEI